MPPLPIPEALFLSIQNYQSNIILVYNIPVVTTKREPIMKFVRDLDGGDYHIAETELNVGSVTERQAVVDNNEGDVVFWIPDSMNTGEQVMVDHSMDTIYIDVANLIFVTRGEWFDKGERSGRDSERSEFQRVLGIDKLVEALGELRTIAIVNMDA